MRSSSSQPTPVDYTLDHGSAYEPSSSSSSSSATLATHSDAASFDAEAAMLDCVLQVVGQPLALLREGVLTDEHMTIQSKLSPGSTIGKHLRHVHDHIRILCDALDACAPAGSSAIPEIDYDRRSRDERLETSSQVALQEFEQLQTRLNRLHERQGGWFEQKVTLCATTPVVQEMKSSVGRELWFVALHSIHHYALARVILTRELGLAIDETFGVAPSTLVQREWKQRSRGAGADAEGRSRKAKL